MTFHPEAIEAAQKHALLSLGPFVTKHSFYLAGGTALALHFGHRLSVDFGWFTGRPMTEPLRLAQNLREENIDFTTAQVAPGTLYGEVGGVQVSFFEYRYPLVGPLNGWLEYEFSLASLDDLACMKLSAIAQRGARKDFVDLYVLGARHKPLPALLALYRQKYAIDVGLLFEKAYARLQRRLAPQVSAFWDAS